MRQSMIHIQNLQRKPPTDCINVINKVIESQGSQCPKYYSLMNLLQNTKPDKVRDHAIFKREKRKVSAKDKTICRVIVETIQHAATPSRAENILSHWANKIKSKLNQTRVRIEREVKHESLLSSLKEDKPSPIQCIEEVDNLSAEPGKSTTERHKITTDTSAKQKRTLVMTRNQMFSGTDLDGDIALTKQNAPAETYFAEEFAAEIIKHYKILHCKYFSF